MNCPKCNAQMNREGLEQLVDDKIFESWLCQACGHKESKKKETKSF